MWFGLWFKGVALYYQWSALAPGLISAPASIAVVAMEAEGGLDLVLPLVVCSVLLCGIVSAATAMGVGALLEKGLAIEPRPIEAFWFGLAAITALVETYHLFRPVDAAIGLALVAAGAIGFFAFRLPASVAGRMRRAGRWTCLIYAAALGVIALRAAAPCKFFDTGLYGAQTIRWLINYPVVPGLANLQGRFGFNSSVFLCMALFSHGPLAPLTYRIFDGLVLAMLLATVVPACARVFSPNGTSGSSSMRSSSEDWFAAILILPLIYRIFESSIIEDLVGTDTDLPAMVIALAALAYLFSALQMRAEQEDSGIRAKLLCADALFALAAVFKLSMVVLAGAGWLVGFLKLLSLRKDRSARRPGWLAYIGIPAAILIPWMIHGSILSGYLFYPSTAFPLPVDWRVPSASVQLESAGIRAWARMPHWTLSQTAGFAWLPGWLRVGARNRAEMMLPVLIAAVGLLLILWSLRNSRSERHPANERNSANAPQRLSRGNLAGLWLLFPTILALAFWFMEAPALRFAQAEIWGIAAILGGYGISRWLENRLWAGRYVLIAILLATGWSLYPRTLWQISFAPLEHVTQASPLPPPDVAPMESNYGVQVFVARTGGGDWDSDLPASDYLTPTLRMRRPGNLAAGFASDGFPPDAEWLASPPTATHGVY